MSVEVILKEHVENLGQRGEIVKVASGYARNYLFPRQLALAVTDENKKQVERERVKAEAKEAEELKGARSLAATLEGLDIAIRAPRGRERHAVRVGHDRRHRRCAVGT
jgi:large subunit ribosomal protein L9